MRSGTTILRQLVQKPGWFVENLRMQKLRRLDARGHALAIEELPELLDVQTALSTFLGVDGGRVEELLRDRYIPRDPDEELRAWNASDQLLQIVWAVVRELKPAVVVETGVARGFSSATILAALARNGGGTLHSVELPALGIGDGFVGKAVPGDLRGAWNLHMGPSRTLLPELTRSLGQIDVFLHDADHTYESQIAEYRTVWPALRKGGVILTDDVNNPAFLDFCREQSVECLLVSQVKQSVVGLTRKP